jgi:predicted deacetylase
MRARVVARGAAEFAMLTEMQAVARLVAGRAELSALRLPVEGFTPPGWLASPGTTQALRRLGYRYTTCHAGVRDLATGGWHPAFALSHRAGGIGERSGARLMVAGARYAVRRGWDIRIALHPADLDRPGLREAALRAVDACLELGAAPTTYLGLLEAASSVSA